MAVGALGLPVNVGEFMSALLLTAVSISANSCRMTVDKPRVPDPGLPVLV